MPEPTVNFDKSEHKDAVDYALNSNYAMLVDTMSFRSAQDIFLSKSEIYFEDKWSTEEINAIGNNFIEIFTGLKWLKDLPDPNEDGETIYSDVYFRAASKRNLYSLDPYKILDLLGDLGGLLDFVRVVGWILTASVVKKAFDISLLSDAYQVQGYNKDSSEFYKSQKARECFQM